MILLNCRARYFYFLFSVGKFSNTIKCHVSQVDESENPSSKLKTPAGFHLHSSLSSSFLAKTTTTTTTRKTPLNVTFPFLRHYRPIYLSLPNKSEFNLHTVPPFSPFYVEDKFSPWKKTAGKRFDVFCLSSWTVLPSDGNSTQI